MKTYFLSLAVLFFIGCTNSSQKKSAQIANVVSSNVEVINVVDLLANAKDYDGKEVIITGTATHVCKHSGKRLHLMGNDEKTKIRVEAGEIGQFERELEGSDIIAKGIFHREVMDEEYMAKWSEELGKEGKGKGKGKDKSHEEQEEEEGKMQRYKEMMGKTADGQLESFWLEGISFETKSLL
jgi:hypothetical protein